MNAIIYNVTSGAIVRAVSCPPNHLAIQCLDGEDFYLNCPPGATHIINNEPVTVLPPLLPEPTAGELMAKIRSARNRRLTGSDWTQVADSPLSPENKLAWAVYRQALRDFPETCDPAAPVWPTAPK